MKDVKPLFERAQITEQMKDKGRKISIKLKAISLKEISKFDSPLARLIRQKLL